MEETFGRYRLLGRLGEGGMAEVFKAKSFGVEGFEKVLCIKRILPRLAAHATFVDMFVHEAKLAVRLSHANIVQVFDLGRIDDPETQLASYFIAMEYVPGLDLATVLGRCRKARTAIPFGMAVYIAAEVAKALDHAHRRRDEQAKPLGIVHRDISPQNVLLSWEGEVKVTDFGIAKAKDSITDEEADDSRWGRVRGKLAYMSPEQSGGQPLDARSDLFSLGTVLYELVAGSNPFTAPTAFETLRRVQSSEFPPLELLRPDTPKPLLEIIGKMLAKRAEDRYPDAGRLHEALLGYFYASGERFGANDLSEFLAPFHERAPAPELETGVVFEDEQTGANDRTPVEVPHVPSVRAPSSGTYATPLPEKVDTGQLVRPEIGERREVTALALSFLDRSGGAGAMASRAREVLARYGATVLEQEASQIVAIFGLGDADGRDTEAAVRAALVILRAGGGAGAVSAGVHVARIVVDAQGAAVKDERLTSLVASAQALARSVDGRVAVSPLAGRIVRTAFATEELASAGHSLPPGARAVSSARPPAAVYGRFVGRHDELKRLGEILALATRKRAQFVTVLGDKGIGKTRLLVEMQRRLTKGSYNVGFYSASCPVNGADVPWSGLTSMLQVLCGIQEGDDEERILNVLPRLRALGLQEDECSAVLSQLGATTSTRPPQNTSAALRTAFASMVQSLCEDRLQCFAWDDAQSMDAATVDAVLAGAGRSPSGLRAVFMFVTREPPPAPVAENPNHHLVPLGELSDEDSSRLISTRVGARVLPPDLLAFCRDRAGGHPLFLEELIKELTDSGAISVMSGAVKAKLEGATTVPRTLRTLIASRVSRLEPNERSTLQAAAILGDPVLTEVLAALLQQNLAQVDRTISGLAKRDFLRITGPAQAGFSSPMHAEIVLDAIPPEARRDLHRGAAAAYVSVVGDESAEHADRVANHLYQSGDRDRAATFFARDAFQRIRVSQLEPAIRQLTRALDLCDLERRSASEILAWIGALAGATSRVRQAPDLPDVAARALRRIDLDGTLEEKVLARVFLGGALGAVNLFEQGFAKLDEAFTLAGEREDLRRRALVAELESAGRSGDFTRALRATEKLEGMGPIDDPRVLLSVAAARAAMGDAVAAIRAIDQAEALQRPDDLVGASEREKQRVLVHIYTRNYRAGLEASARAVDLARAAGMRYDVAVALHNLGDAARRLGDLPRAYASASESRELAEAGGYERLASLNTIHLAYLDALSGATNDSLLRQLIQYADSHGYWTDALEGRYLLASILKQRGDRDQAKREFEEVLRMASSYGNKLVEDDSREALDGL